MRPVVLILLLLTLLTVAVGASGNVPARGSGQRGQASAFQKHMRYAWKKMLEYYTWGVKKFNCYVYGTDCPPTKSPANTDSSTHSSEGDRFFKLPPSVENFLENGEGDDTKAFTIHTFPTPKRV